MEKSNKPTGPSLALQRTMLKEQERLKKRMGKWYKGQDKEAVKLTVKEIQKAKTKAFLDDLENA